MSGYIGIRVQEGRHPPSTDPTPAHKRSQYQPAKTGFEPCRSTGAALAANGATVPDSCAVLGMEFIPRYQYLPSKHFNPSQPKLHTPKVHGCYRPELLCANSMPNMPNIRHGVHAKIPTPALKISQPLTTQTPHPAGPRPRLSLRMARRSSLPSGAGGTLHLQPFP